jgi:hypothetical protein
MRIFMKRALCMAMCFLILLVFSPAQIVSAEDITWAESPEGLPDTGTYFGVDFGDVNNDGNLDCVGASDGMGIRVFLGDGNGGWTPIASHPKTDGGYGDVVLGDYDSDGNLDIFAGSPANHVSNPTGIHVFKGDGSGGFTEVDSATTTLPTSGKWRGVDVGDVNSDGHLDLAATAGYHTSDGLHVYLGDGTGKFSDNSSGLPTNEDRGSAVVLADFNNDGTLDVAAGGPNQVSVFLGNAGFDGSMTWTDSSSGLPSQRFTGISKGDVDNDGLSDLIISSYNAGSGVGLQVYKNNNNGASWTSISTNLPTSGDYLDVSNGDFDSDGNEDIISGGVYGTHGIKLYLGDGSGIWTESTQGLSSTHERVGVDVGDVNSDGSPDILFGRYDNSGLEVWKNQPQSVAPPVVSQVSPLNGASNIPLNADISIAFSIPMNTSATEGAITIDPSISVSEIWSSGDTTLTLSPGSNLNGDTEYSITVSTSAKSTHEVNMGSIYSFSFTTGSTLDTTVPSILGTFPEDDAEDVNPKATIRITFEETMDLTSVENSISISPTAEFTTNWDSTGTILSLQMDLEGETEYTITISSGSRDLAGNQLSGSESITFTTAEKDETSDGSSDTMTLLLIIIIIIVVLIILIYLFNSRKKTNAGP